MLAENSIIFSLDPSSSLPNWLRYGECGEDPAVRQESDDLTSCHRGRRDGQFLNPSRTCLVDKWLQAHPESTGKCSCSCGILALVPREPIYVKYLRPANHFGIKRNCSSENRTCSISFRLDQKSRQFLIFPRSILQNIFTKWPPLLDMAAVKWAQILKTRIVVFLWSTSRNNWMGKLDCVNANIFIIHKKI